MNVTIYGLSFVNEPSGLLHLSLEPHTPNSTLSVGHPPLMHTYAADSSQSWVVVAPTGATLVRQPIHGLVLRWSLNGQDHHSPANEVFSLARLGLHGFRFQ